MPATIADEPRKTVRKVLRVRARVATPEHRIIAGKTLDICGEGMCIMLEEATRPGQVCMLAFDVFVGGSSHPIRCEAKVVYATLNAAEGFRTGFAFQQPSADLLRLVAILS